MLLGSIQADCFPLGPELATGIVLIMLHCSRSTIIIIIESTTTITNNIIILDIYDIYVSWADGLQMQMCATIAVAMALDKNLMQHVNKRPVMITPNPAPFHTKAIQSRQ